MMGKVLIWEDHGRSTRCDLKKQLVHLMLIFWPVPTWGYVQHEALHPRIASLPGTEEASGGYHRLSMLWQGLQRFACAWSEICIVLSHASHPLIRFDISSHPFCG